MSLLQKKRLYMEADIRSRAASKTFHLLTYFQLKRSFALVAAIAYVAAVAILIQAIAAHARMDSHFGLSQAIASSPLNLDDPCNRSTVVEIKICGTRIGIANTRERVNETRSARVSSRTASFSAPRTGGRDPLVPQALAESARQ